MSINADMKPMRLQVKEEVQTPSGATKNNWVDKETIFVVINKTNDVGNTQNIRYNSTQSVRYKSSTHTGLTRCKDIKVDINRLVDNEIVYEVTGVNPKARLTILFLKVVDTNVEWGISTQFW